MQCSVSIGRCDIQTAVVSMSSFREQPRIGQLNCLKRMVGFLANYRDFKIRFHVDKPDNSRILAIPPFEWKYTPYGNPKEDIPKDAPTPCRKRIILTHYFDANLMHNILSGKSVTGIINFWNKTPMDWYSKKQLAAKTSTYGSEFLAGHTCFEQVIDHCNYV